MRRYHAFVTIIGIVVAFLIVILHVRIAIHLPVNLVFISSIAFILFAVRHVAFAAIITLLAMYETVSPLAPFRYSIALSLSVLFFFIFMRRYFTHRSLLGVTVGVAIASIIFELLLFMAGVLFTPETIAWKPIIDSAYFRFVAARVIGATMAMLFIFIIMQRFSPNVRGVIITRSY